MISRSAAPRRLPLDPIERERDDIITTHIHTYIYIYIYIHIYINTYIHTYIVYNIRSNNNIQQYTQ